MRSQRILLSGLLLVAGGFAASSATAECAARVTQVVKGCEGTPENQGICVNVQATNTDPESMEVCVYTPERSIFECQPLASGQSARLSYVIDGVNDDQADGLEARCFREQDLEAASNPY